MTQAQDTERCELATVALSQSDPRQSHKRIATSWG